MTLRKALVAAGIFEMLGALALGAHVAGTMKSGIAKYSCFEAEPALYMVGMMSALGAAAIWILFASIAGLPVSATHSIVGGIVGMAVALKGVGCVSWGMNGVAKIALSWVTSPVLACAAAFAVYTLIVRIIYHSNVSFERALWSTPPLLAGAVLFIEMLVFWDRLPLWWAKLLLFGGTFLLVSLLTTFFGIPYLRRQISNAYLRTSTAESQTIQAQNSLLQSLYQRFSSFVNETGQDDSQQVQLDDIENGKNGNSQSSSQHGHSAESNKSPSSSSNHTSSPPSSSSSSSHQRNKSLTRNASATSSTQLFNDISQDNINDDSDSDAPPTPRYDEEGRLGFHNDQEDDDDHAEASNGYSSSGKQYDMEDHPIEGQEGLVSMADVAREDVVSEDEAKATQVYWYLQNVTACFGAFAHGANDTANTIGPFAAIFHLWRDGTFDAASSVPLWIVAIGGVSIVLGLAILGYRVIRTMGQEIIHIDYPSGFASELSSAMTVVIASRLQIPVSSTHCQVGAIIGVGLVSDTPTNSTQIHVTPLDQSNLGTATDTERDSRMHTLEEETDGNDTDSNDGLSNPREGPSAPSTTSPHSTPAPTRLTRFWNSVKARTAQIQWKSVGKIFISWLVTLPVSAGISALLAIILSQFIKAK